MSRLTSPNRLTFSLLIFAEKTGEVSGILIGLSKMSAAGPDGLEGGMSPKKYISITAISKATATRDLQELYNIGALLREGDGRSTRYYLNLLADT